MVQGDQSSISSGDPRRSEFNQFRRSKGIRVQLVQVVQGIRVQSVQVVQWILGLSSPRVQKEKGLKESKGIGFQGDSGISEV